MSSDNSFNRPFGPYATEVNALQRAVDYLQEHKSNTQSNESADSVTGITPHAPPLDEFQRKSILFAVNEAIAKLEDSFGRSVSLAAYAASTPGRKRTEIVNGQVDLRKHRRFCAVCHHPDREAIEQSFLQWTCVTNIREEFDLPDRRCVYRHARAFGLFEQRAQNLRAALEHIIEQAETVKPTADSVIRAIKAYSCLDDHGHWTELPQRIVVSRVDHAAIAAPPSNALPADAIPVEGHELESPPAPELPPAKT